MKNIYGKYFTSDRVFGWTEKYGQIEINFSWERERERERGFSRDTVRRIYIFSGNNFMCKPNSRNHFSAYFPKRNQTVENVFSFS